MEEEAYEQRIKARDVLDYTTLSITLKELHARNETRLMGEIERILRENEIRPAPASGTGLSKRYFRVDLPVDDLDEITDLFEELEAPYIKGGTPDPMVRFYGSLAEKWGWVTDEEENPA